MNDHDGPTPHAASPDTVFVGVHLPAFAPDYDAPERCGPCMGTGAIPTGDGVMTCPYCAGTGLRPC